MEVTIRHTPDCPNLVLAEGRVRTALADIGMSDVVVRTELVATQTVAERLGFAGSPTILVDGVDPFAGPDAAPALACRRYETPEGPAGAPSVEQLRDAIRRR